MGLLPIKPAEVLLSYTGSANWSAGLSPPLESVPSGHRRVEKPVSGRHPRCELKQFDAITEVGELADHSGGALLL